MKEAINPSRLPKRRTVTVNDIIHADVVEDVFRHLGKHREHIDSCLVIYTDEKDCYHFIASEMPNMKALWLMEKVKSEIVNPQEDTDA